MNKYKIILFMMVTASFLGCEEYLEVKPSKDLVIPQTLQDYRALLDGTTIGMNYIPSLQILTSDNIYVNETGWNSFSSNEERNAYLWKSEITESETNPEWYYCYRQVFNSNLVLEGLEDFEPSTQVERQEKEELMGSALYYRASIFFYLLEMFASPYNPATAADLPGIPLRTSADVNASFPRASIEEGYSRIIEDLKQSLDLLPVQVEYKTRPSKGAVLALLARIHLVREEYELAEDYAYQSLQYNSHLLKYDDLNPSATYPVPEFSEEMIYYNQLMAFSFFRLQTVKIEPQLYSLYEDNDLRKVIFFQEGSDGYATFKGSYTGTYRGFGGLAVDEVYLILAESMVRNNKVDEGMEYLNEMLQTRYIPGTFEPYIVESADEALNTVLTERRKELVFRGLRWSDMRRLNKDPQRAITLERSLNGENYMLPPNDLRYTFLLPPDEIVHGGLQQNPR